MKKLFALVMAVVLSVSGAKAGEPLEEFGIFNHVSIGTGFGILDGISFEAAAPITNYVQMRVGYAFMPKIGYTAKGFEYTKDDDTTGELDVKFKLNTGNFKLLFDVFPAKKSSFHLTVGAYIGKEAILKAASAKDGKEAPVDDVKPGEGLIVGDYTLGPDPIDNIIRAEIRTKKFKPYIGFGFGRPVAKKRVSVTGDFGVMFWGSPTVHGYDVTTGEPVQINKTISDDEQANKFFDVLSKVKVCPVLSVRVNGRLF